MKLNKKKGFHGFEYVVEKQEQAKLCFGSMREKKIKFFIEPNFITPSPCVYDLTKTDTAQKLTNRPCSIKGSAPIVSDFDRFRLTIQDFVPAPNKYHLEFKWGDKKQDSRPFGSQTGRSSLILNNNAGVGTYNVAQRLCRRTNVQSNFGFPKMINAVETICVPSPIDKCDRCVRLIQGDYWQKNYTNYLCQPCMTDERKVHEMYSENLLKQFKKIRNCSFKHRHEGTTAAIQLLHPKQVHRRICHENYLSLFMKSGN